MNPPDQLLDELELLEPIEPFRFPWWLVVVVIVGLLAWGLFRWWRKKQAPGRWLTEINERSYEDALAALKALVPLIDGEDSLAYADASSAIIRRYLETRFCLQTRTRTTEEFLARAVRSPALRPKHQRSLTEYLRHCDVLKFSRATAGRPDLLALHEAAVAFVKETRDAHLAPEAPAVPA